MTAYSDKIDASYAKLKAVLAEGAGAAAGFKSSLPRKSQVMARQLSEEVVGVLLEEIMQFVMHMTSASIDQVSGRLEEKLARLGEEGLALSDETVQKIKDALAEVPGASSAVAQLLNGIGKDRRLDELDAFFKTELPDGGSAEGNAPAGGGPENQAAEDGESLPDLSSGDFRKKFAEYLDKALPNVKYFNQFFQRVFDTIQEFLGGIQLAQNLAGQEPASAIELYSRAQDATSSLDAAVEQLIQSVSGV